MIQRSGPAECRSLVALRPDDRQLSSMRDTEHGGNPCGSGRMPWLRWGHRVAEPRRGSDRHRGAPESGPTQRVTVSGDAVDAAPSIGSCSGERWLVHASMLDGRGDRAYLTRERVLGLSRNADGGLSRLSSDRSCSLFGMRRHGAGAREAQAQEVPELSRSGRPQVSDL